MTVTFQKMILAGLAVCLLSATAQADLVMGITNVSTSPTGGSFIVTATPQGLPSPPLTTGSLGVTLQFNNLVGIASITGIELTSLLPGMSELPSIFGTTIQPATATNGSTVHMEASGNSTIVAGTNNLMQVDYTVAGFNPPDQFEVAFVPSAGFVLETYVSDGIGGQYNLLYGPSSGLSTVAAVPEASSFLYLGIAGVLGLAAKKWRRQEAA